jgi:enoyl-CoA hydratase
MSDAEVIARVEGAVGRVTLNRPRVLHALTLEMCQAMTDALLAWRDDPVVHTVLIEHAGERGFCAGGDIRAVARDQDDAKAFFRAEYGLNVLLFRYPKPVVAIMDGVVMGGGAGLAIPARFRIATERTVFAMPEVAIGLFPDVGMGWRLPRLHGAVGLWLALTGARLGAADCLLLGLATDYVQSSRIEALKADLLAAPDRFEMGLTELEDDAGEPPIALWRDEIDRLFDQDSVEAIITALLEDGSAWAKAQLDSLLSGSPTTLKVAHRLLRLGAQVSRFEDEMAIEYRVATRISASHDFREGVRALLVDKTRDPAWSHPTLAQVDDTAVAALFEPLPQNEEFRPSDRAFRTARA